ncbi:hypothetical protein [Hirschia baltica]|uniref:NADH:ubiquinone oxidoreductase intermediate-associated protein 30 domain-containing protein n=1 Tax=Hirschia baltica (strain ATCC 49814 / DSM 5838 / IFAM 1418) TaxID=582402 RepID=C6XNF5_HIRBI|nr:hypothetical protein [Hirschia baltica]ACT60099.1 hypothetical protein Hbal_2419 [Hirschia baltica ATCC 49814]
MSDKFFFSSCVLVGTILLLLALSPWSDKLPTGAMSAANLDTKDLLVKNRNLNRFITGEAGKLELSKTGDSYLLKIGVKQGELYDLPSFGPHLRLEADVEKAYAKQFLKITIIARQPANYKESGPNEKMAFEANYAANATETSGWQKFTLEPQFSEFSFEYRPPGAGDGIGNDFFALRPVTADQGFDVEVKSVRFEMLASN